MKEEVGKIFSRSDEPTKGSSTVTCPAEDTEARQRKEVHLGVEDRMQI